MVQKVQTEWQALYSHISATNGIWFVCTVFVYIFLIQQITVFSYVQYMYTTYKGCSSKVVSCLMDYSEKGIFDRTQWKGLHFKKRTVKGVSIFKCRLRCYL